MNARLNRWFAVALFCLLLLPFPVLAVGSHPGEDWHLAVLDDLLASVPAGETSVQVSDMLLPVAYLQAWRNQLAGGPQPKVAFSSTFNQWPGGNVYYAFDASVSTTNRRAFLDAAAEWATFANLHFIQRVAQADYILVTNNPSLGGGLSYVGKIGGAQLLQIGPDAWNRGILCHELGHALGLVHEHQRSDRASYVTIITNNILSGYQSDFLILPTSQNQGAYDFLSIMHYVRNAFSVNAASNTIQPLPAYAQYLDLMGRERDPVLSASDRAGMAQIYGLGPGATNLVTNTLDGGLGSLRAALYYAFDHPGTTISFNIPTTDAGFSNSVFNILPTDSLPSLRNATTLDGSTQPTNSNPSGPEIRLNGALGHTTSVYANGLQLKGTNSTIRSFTVNNFPASGIVITGSNAVGNTVAGCYVGVDPTGSFAVTNGDYPVQILAGAVSNTVGGLTAAARNLISGGVYQGLVIRDVGTRLNTVQGNYIGLNAAGTAALPNNWSGVEISSGAAANIIGPANVISGNGQDGVRINNASNNVVQGNWIGLNAAGMASVGNGSAGVWIYGGSRSNIIGGYLTTARNLISGNASQGVVISDPGSSGNLVAGNYIGVNPAGTVAFGNGLSGVELYDGAANNDIASNLISGNLNYGVFLRDPGTANNAVWGNFIGVNASGAAALGNVFSGVMIYTGAQSNRIGGTVSAARNLISGNTQDGVWIYGNGAANNVVQGNFIGFNAAGTTALPNSRYAMIVYAGAQANVIGGVTLGAANLVSGSTIDGIYLDGAATTNNTVRGNSIFNNAGAAIGIYNGANRNLAAPTLTAAVVTTNTAVAGSYSGTNGTVYQLDFYADAPPAGSAESMTYLGSKSVTGTGAAAAFTANLGALLPSGRAVTATANDPAGNTSRLSPGRATTLTSGVNDGLPNAWRALYFGGSGTTTNSQSAAWADPDNDGLSNYQEFFAGTNPTNAASALKLTAFNPSTTNAIGLNSVSGVVYRVQYRDDLVAGSWNTLAEQIMGTGTNIFLPDAAAASLAGRFYRAQVLW